MKKISGGVLQLNFMRRSLNQILLEEQKDKKKVKEENPVYPTVLRADEEPIPSLDGITREDRFTKLETLRFGRFSFNGQNPEVEKLMSGRPRKRPHEEDPEEDLEEDVSRFGRRRKPKYANPK